jgi:hypothetical protein
MESSSGKLNVAGVPFTVVPVFAHLIEGEPRRRSPWRGAVMA